MPNPRPSRKPIEIADSLCFKKLLKLGNSSGTILIASSVIPTINGVSKI